MKLLIRELELVMNLKNILVSATAATAIFFGSLAQAQTSFRACVNAPLADFDGSIVDAAVATPDLSILVDLLFAADLVGALEEAEDITVYAPTNAAFGALPTELVDVLLANTEALTSVLVYHVSPGTFDPRVFLVPTKRPTLLEDTSVVFHREGGEQRVNQSAVDCNGVQTDNGRVFFIDRVLLPGFAS